MPSKRITLTLPPDLFDAVEAAAAQENRSRSKLIRVALRQYLNAPPLPAALVDQIEDALELHDPQAVRALVLARQEARDGEARDAGFLLAELEEALRTSKRGREPTR